MKFVYTAKSPREQRRLLWRLYCVTRVRGFALAAALLGAANGTRVTHAEQQPAIKFAFNRRLHTEMYVLTILRYW